MLRQILTFLPRLRPTGDHALFGVPSATGLLLGALAFAVSLGPSMIPRTGLLQGVLAGVTFALAYAIGASVVALWCWIYERCARPRWALALIPAGVALVWALTNVTGWQNGIHAAMGMAPVESARPFTILGVGVAVALLLVLLGRLFRRLWRLIAAQLDPLIPRRLSIAIGILASVMVFWALGNDVVLGRVLRLMDSSYAAVDQLIPADKRAPEAAEKTGSPKSLVEWEDLGAEGRRWIVDGPDADAITAVTGQPAQDPLRIYVGLNNAPDAEARAALALEEAIRVGAFARSTLVIATPTGTGWMDPAGLRPLDLLTGGDVATVAVQYSYLPSWLSLFVQPEYGEESADAVFRAIYGHWRTLPADARPKLYLFGLSLGVRNGELAISWPDLVADPIQGALWVGPPFAAKGWRQILTTQPPGVPVWAPRVRDGSVMRVRTQAGDTDPGPRAFGPMRVVWLAHPSDPIVFFSPDIIWRAPDWLEGSRGPDVSDQLRWYPLVTFLQLGFDMMTATTTPEGFGHVYAPRDYLRAWNEVLATDWPEDRLQTAESALDALR